MSRLTKEQQDDLIRSGETMQCTKNNPLGMPPGAVGDVNSKAKGSGARYNVGKPPYDLVPLCMLVDCITEMRCDESGWKPKDALYRLGEFQARSGDDLRTLRGVLRTLGLAGWEECARVFEYGRAKYAAWNWAKGMHWSVPIGCAARHLLAMHRGEEIDPESKLPHRGHVFCNIVMLYTYCSTFKEGDDRPAAGLLA